LFSLNNLLVFYFGQCIIIRKIINVLGIKIRKVFLGFSRNGVYMINNDILKEFEATKEYEEWQESLFAIIGYTMDEKINDEELAGELMADHLKASLELGKGLELAKYESGKKMSDEFLRESHGE